MTQQTELENVLLISETAIANKILQTKNSMQTKAFKRLEFVKATYPRPGQRIKKSKQPITSVHNPTKNNRFQQINIKLNSLTEEFKGEYILLAASPNDTVWSSTIRAYGSIASEFLESRTGKCLTDHWHHLFDDKQKERIKRPSNDLANSKPTHAPSEDPTTSITDTSYSISSPVMQPATSTMANPPATISQAITPTPRKSSQSPSNRKRASSSVVTTPISSPVMQPATSTMANPPATISQAITPTPSTSSQSPSNQKRARSSVVTTPISSPVMQSASSMAITPAPFNPTSPSSSVSSQNPTTLNVNANPAIFSPDIRPTILSSPITPSTPQKLKEKVVKAPIKGNIVKRPEGMFLKMSDGKMIAITTILKEPFK